MYTLQSLSAVIIIPVNFSHVYIFKITTCGMNSYLHTYNNSYTSQNEL